MAEPSPRYEELFLQVFESLPRQGPGSYASAARAFGLCRGIPPAPDILDLGCGTGAQTFHLAELTGGVITAVDRHAPSIGRLEAAVAHRHLSHRIRPLLGDMTQLPFAPGSFDLIWSEGALYNIGIDTALRLARALLRPAGHLVFTDAVWCKPNPPADVRALFESDYPDMGGVPEIIALIGKHGFELLGHFPLDTEAWWHDFYTPMLERVAEIRHSCAGDVETLAALDQIAREAELQLLYADYYAYEFFVARRPL